MKERSKFITIILVTLIIFTSFSIGVYAHSTWVTFKGDEHIANTEDNIDEIMDILEQIHNDKLTAEEALIELEGMNPHGLVKQIKELKEELQEMSEYVNHLEEELERANTKVNELNNKSDGAVEKARGYLNY